MYLFRIRIPSPKFTEGMPAILRRQEQKLLPFSPCVSTNQKPAIPRKKVGA